MSKVQPISETHTDRSEVTVFGLYSPGVNLAEVAHRLEEEGLRPNDVCIVLPETHPTSAAIRHLSSGAEPSAQFQAVLAWLSKFGAVMIRGLGSFVSARQFVTALLSGKDGPTAIETALRCLGVPADQSERYANGIATGGVFVLICCQSEEEGKTAAELLESTGAEEVCSEVIAQPSLTPPELRKAG